MTLSLPDTEPIERIVEKGGCKHRHDDGHEQHDHDHYEGLRILQSVGPCVDHVADPDSVK